MSKIPPNHKRIVIPANANLEDVIAVLNGLEFTIDVNSDEFKKFAYDKKEWFLDKDA